MVSIHLFYSFYFMNMTTWDGTGLPNTEGQISDHQDMLSKYFNLPWTTADWHTEHTNQGDWWNTVMWSMMYSEGFV